MNIKELLNKYKLSKDEDVWQHQQSGQWILTHNAVEKIAFTEGIEIVDIKVLNSDMDLVRFLVTMSKGDKTISSIGEADRKNCRMNFLGAMAEKRGIDRCVLKLIHAYEYGISSEVEADDFAKPYYYEKTDNQLEKFEDLLKHPYFKGKRQSVKKQWKDQSRQTDVELMLKQMKQRTEGYDKENVIYED